MINSPEANITETEAEELAKVKLANIEKEVRIANGNLVVINKDITKAIESLKYQEELVAKIEQQIPEKGKELASLEASIKQLTETSMGIGEENKARGLELGIKEKELKEKTLGINELGEILVGRENAVREKEQKIAEDRAITDKALADFLKIKWS